MQSTCVLGASPCPREEWWPCRSSRRHRAVTRVVLSSLTSGSAPSTPRLRTSATDASSVTRQSTAATDTRGVRSVPATWMPTHCARTAWMQDGPHLLPRFTTSCPSVMVAAMTSRTCGPCASPAIRASPHWMGIGGGVARGSTPTEQACPQASPWLRKFAL